LITVSFVAFPIFNYPSSRLVNEVTDRAGKAKAEIIISVCRFICDWVGWGRLNLQDQKMMDHKITLLYLEMQDLENDGPNCRAGKTKSFSRLFSSPVI